MARLDGLLFGYTVFTVEKEDVAHFSNALLKLGVNAKIKKNNTCELRLSDAARVRSELRGKIDFTETEMLGLPGFIYRNRHRYGTFLGILAAVMMLVFSSGTVWDVRVSGLGDEECEEVTELLGELGLSVGARWGNLDKNEVEARLLTLSDDVAWVNINRRGTVAYVTVKEKDSFSEDKGGPEYANVIATADAVIEEISVKSGYPAVKVGDSVRAGDILISGVIPGELGGGFCLAEGTVIGRTQERYSVSVSKAVEEKTYLSEKQLSLGYKILGFSINILKNSGNSSKMCDIIEYKSNFTIFGKYKLPIERYATTELSYKLTTRERGTDELLAAAASELSVLLRSELSGAELLKIKTGGEFTEDGYFMYSDLTALRNIGTAAEFSKSDTDQKRRID